MRTTEELFKEYMGYVAKVADLEVGSVAQMTEMLKLPVFLSGIQTEAYDEGFKKGLKEGEKSKITHQLN